MSNQFDEYKVIKSNRKTTALEVSRDAQLIVRVPRYMSITEIHSIINKNQLWIKEKLSIARSKLSERVEYTLEENTDLLINGKFFKIILIEKGTSKIDFNSNQVKIKHANYSLLSRNEKRDVIVKLIKKECKSWFKEELDYCCFMYGFTYKSLTVSSSQKRWGSCSVDNRINLTWRLAMAPEEMRRYVIIHELAHTLEKNHSYKFWNLVEKKMPNYTANARWFKEKGHLLNL